MAELPPDWYDYPSHAWARPIIGAAINEAASNPQRVINFAKTAGKAAKRVYDAGIAHNAANAPSAYRSRVAKKRRMLPAQATRGHYRKALGVRRLNKGRRYRRRIRYIKRDRHGFDRIRRY